MVDSSLKPHVPPEANPSTVMKLLERLFEETRTFETVKALRQFSSDHGLSDRQEIPAFMFNIGLLEHTVDSFIIPSETARIVLANDEKVRIDLVHFLIYTGWTPDNPMEKSDLWGYRQVCNVFWERSPVEVLALTDFVTEEVRNKALLQFEQDVSFSPKSIRGVRKWLEALSPTVIENNCLARRQYVHPQLLLLAAGWVAQNSEGEIGIDMLLTPERREAICRLCLLEPSALDQALDWMLPRYTHIVEPGTTSGIYGRFLRFNKWPTVEDLTSVEK